MGKGCIISEDEENFKPYLEGFALQGGLSGVRQQEVSCSPQICQKKFSASVV